MFFQCPNIEKAPRTSKSAEFQFLPTRPPSPLSSATHGFLSAEKRKSSPMPCDPKLGKKRGGKAAQPARTHRPAQALLRVRVCTYVHVLRHAHHRPVLPLRGDCQHAVNYRAYRLSTRPRDVGVMSALPKSRERASVRLRKCCATITHERDNATGREIWTAGGGGSSVTHGRGGRAEFSYGLLFGEMGR